MNTVKFSNNQVTNKTPSAQPGWGDLRLEFRNQDPVTISPNNQTSVNGECVDVYTFGAYYYPDEQTVLTEGDAYDMALLPNNTVVLGQVGGGPLIMFNPTT